MDFLRSLTGKLTNILVAMGVFVVMRFSAFRVLEGRGSSREERSDSAGLSRGVSLVAVVVSHPVHAPALVTSFWGMIEIVIGADENVGGAGVSGVGVKDLADP